MKNHESLSRICATQEHEFVIFDSLCIAVRDREQGAWLDEHFAIDERVGLLPTGSGPERGWQLVVYTLHTQVRLGPVVLLDDPRAMHAAASMPVTRARVGLERPAAV